MARIQFLHEVQFFFNDFRFRFLKISLRVPWTSPGGEDTNSVGFVSRRGPQGVPQPPLRITLSFIGLLAYGFAGKFEKNRKVKIRCLFSEFRKLLVFLKIDIGIIGKLGNKTEQRKYDVYFSEFRWFLIFLKNFIFWRLHITKTVFTRSLTPFWKGE